MSLDEDNPFACEADVPAAISPDFSFGQALPDEAAGSGAEWECPFCTFLNPVAVDDCELGCGGRKPGAAAVADPPAVADSTPLRSSTSGLRASTDAGRWSLRQSQSSLTASSSGVAAAAAAAGVRSSMVGWFCLVCTAQNNEGATSCDICGTVAGEMQPPPTPYQFDQTYVDPSSVASDGAPPLQAYIRELLFKIADQIVEVTGPDVEDYRAIVSLFASAKSAASSTSPTPGDKSNTTGDETNTTGDVTNPSGEETATQAASSSSAREGLLGQKFIDLGVSLRESRINDGDRFPALSALRTAQGNIVQLYVTQQRGSSCCGYHAFFNAIQANSACLALRHNDAELALRFIRRLNQNPSFIRFYETSKDVLRQHADSLEEPSWIWTPDIIDSGLLERCYATYLIQCREHLSKQLGGRSHFTPLADFHEHALKNNVNPLTTLCHVSHVFERMHSAATATHSFFIGALNHWVTFTVNKFEGDYEMLFFDSRNLPILGADDDQLRLVATDALGSRANEPDKLQRFVHSLKQTLYQVDFFWQCATGRRVFLSECLSLSIAGFVEEFDRVHDAALQAAAAPPPLADEPWECTACTLVNTDRFDRCDACETDRPAPPARELTAAERTAVARQALLQWLDVAPVAIAEKEVVPRIRALLPYLTDSSREQLNRWLHAVRPPLAALEEHIAQSRLAALTDTASADAAPLSADQSANVLRLKPVVESVADLLDLDKGDLLASLDRHNIA